MARSHYVQLDTANKSQRAGDWRRLTGSAESMQRQAHRLAYVKASQNFGAFVESVDGGYTVRTAEAWIATYRVAEVADA